MTRISAKQALMPDGWRKDVVIEIGDHGRISSITADGASPEHRVGVLLPALSNVHSHSFQRAMSGLAETRGPSARDNFWTWREVMYRFLAILDPEDIGDIAALVQMEMLEAGYAAQAEFHYVHHAPGGAAYSRIDETSRRHIDAAKRTGIGYTHLPVLYMQGGLDGRPLEGGQLRFGCQLDQYRALFDAIKASWDGLPGDFNLGVAPHSLRAVTEAGLHESLGLAPEGPVHIHAAEQMGEVKEVQDALGARPIRWLIDNMPVDQRWCFIHATHLDGSEIDDLADSKAVAGLCPITEANLGDGIFNAPRYLDRGGAIGIGSDSNVKIALSEELRMLEVSQRLRDQRRVILTSEEMRSNGRLLYDAAARGGAQALGRDSGRIAVGALADLVALDDNHLALTGLTEDAILDSWIFGCADDVVGDVWAAGRHVVSRGVHIHRQQITEKYKNTIYKLRQTL